MQRVSCRLEITKRAVMTFLWLVLLVFAFVEWREIDNETAILAKAEYLDQKFYLLAESDNNDNTFSMIPEGNVGNQDYSADSIEPGCYGTMTCYVRPTEDGEMTLSFDIDMEYELYDNSKQDLVENITDGHIMFFENKEGEIYSDRIEFDETSDSFRFEKNFGSCKSDEVQEVNVYWIWAYKAEQLVLSENNPDAVFKPLVEENDREEIIQDMTDHGDRYFLEDINLSELDFDDYSDIYKINSAWDDADNCIGRNVKNIRLSLNANRKMIYEENSNTDR